MDFKLNNENISDEVKYEESSGEIQINEIENLFVKFKTKAKIKYFKKQNEKIYSLHENSKNLNSENPSYSEVNSSKLNYTGSTITDSLLNNKIVNKDQKSDTFKTLYSSEKNIGLLQQNFDDKLNVLLKENKEEILNKKIEEQFRENSKKNHESNEMKKYDIDIESEKITSKVSCDNLNFNKIILYKFDQDINFKYLLGSKEFSLILSKYLEKVNEKQFKNNLDINYISELINMSNLEILIFSELQIPIENILKENLTLKNIYISLFYEIAENDFSKITLTFEIKDIKNEMELSYLINKKVNLVMYLCDLEEFEAYIDEKVSSLLQI